MLTKLADAILEGKASLPADQQNLKPRPAPSGNGPGAAPPNPKPAAAVS